MHARFERRMTAIGVRPAEGPIHAGSDGEATLIRLGVSHDLWYYSEIALYRITVWE